MAPIGARQLRTFKWRYVDNLVPSLAYWRSRPLLSGEAARVLAELNRDGVSITSARSLLGPDSLYNDLSAAVNRLEHHLADQIATARAAANDPQGHKTFIFNLLGDRPALDPNDIYVRFAMQKPILQISNAYFGMHTRLRFYNVWHTFTTQAPARERDRIMYLCMFTSQGSKCEDLFERHSESFLPADKEQAFALTSR